MDDETLQGLLDEAAAKCGVVGAQLAIVHRNELREYATGWRNQELQLPTTPDTLFQIGSTTKVFNAAVVMSVVDSGELDLDEPVCKYLPDLRLASWEAQRSVTLRYLLSMTAGIDNGPYHDYGRGDDAVGRYVQALAGLPQLFKPGTAFGYSNASSNIAGHTAARVMAKSWEQLLAERILGPLSLRASAVFAEDLLHHPVALGYSDGKRLPGWALPRSMGPAGGMLCCSAGDLARFARMFLDRGASALSAAAVEAMQTPQVELPTRVMAHQWCCGPYRKVWDAVALYGHSGTNVGGSSMLLWCPERRFAIATTVNVASQGYPFAELIFEQVFPVLFGIAMPLPSTPRVVEELGRYVGRFESFGSTVCFTLEQGRLFAEEESEYAVTRSELMPLGGDRFAPVNRALSGNRGWDVAFWGSRDGRPTHYLGGIMAYRRVGL